MNPNQDTPQSLVDAFHFDRKARLNFERELHLAYPIGTIISATFRSHAADHRVVGISWGASELIVERVGAEHLKRKSLRVGPYGTPFKVISRPEPVPQPRRIIAANFRMFEQYCLTEGLNRHDPNAVIYIDRRQKIIGLPRFTDIEVLPGGGTLGPEKLDAVEYIESRGGHVKFIESQP